MMHQVSRETRASVALAKTSSVEQYTSQLQHQQDEMQNLLNMVSLPLPTNELFDQRPGPATKALLRCKYSSNPSLDGSSMAQSLQDYRVMRMEGDLSRPRKSKKDRIPSSQRKQSSFLSENARKVLNNMNEEDGLTRVACSSLPQELSMDTTSVQGHSTSHDRKTPSVTLEESILPRTRRYSCLLGLIEDELQL